MAMIFIPGMRPGLVSGAAGANRRQKGDRLVFGTAHRGKATPRNIVPFEMPRKDSTAAKRAKEARAKDVSDSLHFHRDAPASAKEKLREVRAAAETVAV